MTWLFLMIAGVFEVFWAICLKLSHGFTRWGYTVLTVAGMIVSFYFLAQATKTLPLRTSYAIWTGIGILGTTIVGVFLFRETMTFVKAFFLLLLLAGIVGLKVTSSQ